MSESIQEKLAALAELVESLPAPAPARAAPDEAFRWLEIDRQTTGQISGRRVLVVGGDVAADAHAFAARGAHYVVACIELSGEEPGNEPAPSTQAGIEHLTVTWQELDPSQHGQFDVVLCNDLVHRVTEPLTLLQRLRAMMSDAGILLVGSMMIDDPERSEYLRFVPDRYAGDPSWWFVPGRLAFRWIVQAAGFQVEAEFGEREGPRDLFPVVTGYLKAMAR